MSSKGPASPRPGLGPGLALVPGSCAWAPSSTGRGWARSRGAGRGQRHPRAEPGITTAQGLAEYCTLIDSSSSFRAYRAALAEVEPPCIPYLGLILQDLTFVHLGNPDYIDGKVNFSKRWQQFNILDSMRCFQQA